MQPLGKTERVQVWAIGGERVQAWAIGGELAEDEVRPLLDDAMDKLRAEYPEYSIVCDARPVFHRAGPWDETSGLPMEPDSWFLSGTATRRDG